jgi:nucleoside-diphosphate-sugar epimerase
MVSSTWSYMPIAALPLAETHPRTGGPRFAQMRREAEDALIAAGAGVVHLPDFFGPHVHDATLQMALADAVAGRAMRWLGGRHVRRDYIFVPDAAALTAELALCEDAPGEHWIVPGSGPVSGAEIAVMVSARLARGVRLRTAGLATLRLAALFDRRLAGFLQIAPEYVKPVSYDGGRIERLLGPRPRSAYDVAIAKTLEWLIGEEA